MTRYEDEAPRLAEASGVLRWGAFRCRIHVVDPYGKPAQGMSVGAGSAVATGWREEDAALIAYHHPARVQALAAVVARLRERAAEGHARECMKRFRPETMACKCGHEDDVEALRRLDEEA